MSTKIYNGLQIQYMPIKDLVAWSKKARKELIPVAKEEFTKSFVKMVEAAIVYVQTGVQIDSCIHDYNALKELENPNYKDVFSILDKEVRSMIKANKSANTIMEFESAFGLDSTVYVFPLENNYLAIPLIDNDAIHKAFKNLPEVSWYGYWNNVDAPEDMSEEEWEQRKKDWDEALPGCGVIRENGFCFDLIDTMWDAYEWCYDPEKHIIPKLSDQAELLNKVAKTILRDKKFQELAENYGELDIASKAMRVVREANEYVTAHPEEVEEIKKTVNLDVIGFLKKTNEE